MQEVSHRRLLPLGLLLGLLLAALLAASQGAAAGGAPGCGSFATQAEAQEAFVAAGGTPSHPVGRLDPDHDGVACEQLPPPYQGYATIGYNRAHDFVYGTATMPSVGPKGFACLYGNRHFPEAARKVIIYKVLPGEDKPLVGEYTGAAEARPESGRLLWRVDRSKLLPGRYYATFQERVRTHPYGANECPGFSSRPTELPRPPRRHR